MRTRCEVLLHQPATVCNTHCQPISAGFFEQFGTVSKLRLSRNKKTGKSKHFAFLQFATAEIAGIVADAMNGYMLMGQKLQCKVRGMASPPCTVDNVYACTQVLLKSEVHEDLWKGANRRFRTIPWRKVEMKRHNAPRTPEQSAQRLQRAVARDRKRMARIAAAGIEYEYDALEASEAPTKQAKKRAAPTAKEGHPAKKPAAKAAKVQHDDKVVVKAAKAKGRAADLKKAKSTKRK